MPRVGSQDAFEIQYRNELKALLTPHGLVVEYEEDLAALDLGIHLYRRPVDGDPAVSNVRVWFQAKGIRTDTLSAAELQASPEVAVRRLLVSHVRYWYGAPEPVYLVVYVESANRFLVEDIRDVVDRAGGTEMLANAHQRRQNEITLHVRSDAGLEEAIEQMPRHKSIRVDGPAFRGRPLGHRLDPLRCELDPFTPEDFASLVDALLAAHDFRWKEDVDLSSAVDSGVGQLSTVIGNLHLTYEWVSPLFTEYGYATGTDFRIESPPEHAQGDVLVVVHSDPAAAPQPTAATQQLVTEIEERGINTALVFFNGSELNNPDLFGGWRRTLDPVARVPQGLGSLSFNLLTATLVYLEFIDRVRWRYVNLL